MMGMISGRGCYANLITKNALVLMFCYSCYWISEYNACQYTITIISKELKYQEFTVQPYNNEGIDIPPGSPWDQSSQ